MDYITAFVTLVVVFVIPAAIVTGIVTQRPRARQGVARTEQTEPPGQHGG